MNLIQIEYNNLPLTIYENKNKISFNFNELSSILDTIFPDVKIGKTLINRVDKDVITIDTNNDVIVISQKQFNFIVGNSVFDAVIAFKKNIDSKIYDIKHSIVNTIIHNKELQTVNYNNSIYFNSLQVAEFIGKRHDHLLRDIKSYLSTIKKGVPKNGDSDYFVESSYTTKQNKQTFCYLITKKGCDMIANKLTGEKGIFFTKSYIDAFYAMDKQLVKTHIQAITSSELVEKINAMEAIQREHSRIISELSDLLTLSNVNWRMETNKLIKRIAKSQQDFTLINILYRDCYNLLEKRMHVKLNIRLSNMKQRLIQAGKSAKEIDKCNILDVIAIDPKLIEGYITVVRDIAIKYNIHLTT